MITIKLTDAIELMDRCILSCTSTEQLYLTMDWVCDVVTLAKFPTYDPSMVLDARSALLKGIKNQSVKIDGIGDENEVDILATSIHPQ